MNAWAITGLSVIGTGLAAYIADWVYARIILHRLHRCERDVEFTEHGIRKGCEPFTVGTGDPALLMVHGFADSPSLYSKTAPFLAEKGYTCRAMLLPGFSRSHYPLFHPVTAQQWIRALAEEIQALSTGHDQVWVIGHSLGAAIALRYLQEYQDGICGLVIMAPLINVSPRRSPLLLPPKAWHFIGRKTLRFTRMIENIYTVDSRDPDIRLRHPHDRFIPVHIYRELFRLINGLQRYPLQFNLPLLTLLAEEDRVVEETAARKLHLQWPAARKSLHVITDSGHMLPLDYGWETVAQHIDRFIRET